MSVNAPKFNSIVTFRTSLAQLCKKEKHGYSSCREDICGAFKNLSFEDIWGLNTMLREMGNIRLLKIRLTNSGAKLSSADGFRLLVCCNKSDHSVTFLNVYPKRGKYGLLNQSKEETVRQLKTYLKSTEKNDFVYHDITKALNEVPVPALTSSTSQQQPS